jgi:hypothetical protein
MKRIGKLITVFIWLSSLLNAEIIFSLQDQYFENAYKQSVKASLYEMKNVSISMVNILQYNDGTYESPRDGTFVITLKKPISNFNIGIKGMYESIHKGKTPSIVVKSDTGNEIVISFDKDKIIMDGIVFKIKELYKKTLNFNIEKNNHLLVISVNGQVFLKKDINKFGNLNKVEQIILGNSGYSADRLYDITISSK